MSNKEASVINRESNTENTVKKYKMPQFCRIRHKTGGRPISCFSEEKQQTRHRKTELSVEPRCKKGLHYRIKLQVLQP